MMPVDVISVCNADGKIYPLRLRLETYEQGRVPIHIEQILSTHESHRVGLETQIFWCRATLHRRTVQFELHYAVRKHSWYLIADGTLRQ